MYDWRKWLPTNFNWKKYHSKVIKNALIKYHKIKIVIWKQTKANWKMYLINQCFYLVKIKQDIMGHKLDWVCRSWEGWTVYEPIWPRNQIR